MRLRRTKKPANQLAIGYARDEDIKPLFELLGLTAKVNGRVAERAIEEIDKFITGQLGSSQRSYAISCFRSGKDLSLVKGIISKRAFQLYGFNEALTVERWLEPLQVLDILLRVAMADGKFSIEDEFIVDTVRSTLAVNVRSYWVLRDTLAERYGIKIDASFTFAHKAGNKRSPDSEETHSQRNESHKQQASIKRATLSVSEALGVLQLGEEAGMGEIKGAYRRLVKLYHPDSLKSKQASDAEIKTAIENFCRIQEAYERLIR